MKSVLVLSFLFGMSAQAVMAPTGVHTTVRCKSTVTSRDMVVNVLRDTRRPNYVALSITSDGQEKIYKAKQVNSTMIGGSTVFQAPIAGGMLTLSVNFTTAPRPGGARPGTLTSAAYGHAVKTPVMCSRVMY